MPCDSVVQQRVNLTKAVPDVLAKALESLGGTIDAHTPTLIRARGSNWTAEWQKGSAVIIRSNRYAGTAPTVEDVTRAYSRSAVTWAAKKAGWLVKGIQGNENKFIVTRR